MLTRKQKEDVVKELADKIKRQKSLIFTDVTGVNVVGIQGLRNKLRQAGVEYKVFKKSLIDLALKKQKQDLDISDFTGSIALAFGYDDPIASTKILDSFKKQNDNLKILGGIMGNKILTIEDIKELAKIPSKNELLAILINNLKAPINGLVNVLQGNIRNLLLILKQI